MENLLRYDMPSVVALSNQKGYPAMPLQNRVDPQGQIRAVPELGCFMGNRGILHNDQRQIVRSWKLQRWITCALEHGRIKRTPMTPGAYTELFFLDEPTSYAAGHRPCSSCRNSEFKAFKAAWGRAFPEIASTSEAIDRTLHIARVLDDGSQRTWRSRLRDLPDGTMIDHFERIILLWNTRQWAWSFSGYELTAEPIRDDEEVDVLTPEPIVRLFAAGLSQSLQVHPTAHIAGHAEAWRINALEVEVSCETSTV